MKKNTVFIRFCFLALLCLVVVALDFTPVQAQTTSVVADRIRAAEYLRIGANNSQKVTGFNTVIPGVPTDEKLPTTKAVVDYVLASFIPLGQAAGGDLSGTYPNPVVDGLQGYPVSATAPISGKVLKWNGSAWAPADDNTGNSYTAGTGISIGVGNVINNEGDLSATNELNTSLSVTSGNLRLTDPGGNLDVPVSSIAPVQAVTAGTGISISGTTTRTVTNTGDLSATNEIQTLSLSGSDLSLSLGGGTVTLPGVSWPLLAPDGTAGNPSYAFANSEESGMFYDGVLKITAASQGVSSAKSLEISAGTGAGGNGGNLTLNAGSSTGRGGGAVFVNAGSGNGRDGGNVIFIAGNGTDAIGGQVTMIGGDGTFAGGSFNLLGGNSVGGQGGTIALTPGNGADASQNGYILLGGNGVVFVDRGVADISAFSTLLPGLTVYCVDCIANDGSAGVLQTYNGSTWKNHW